MSPELAYQKFLLKINKGNSGFNIACDKARFVLIINEVKNRWVEFHLKSKDSILIDSIQETVKTFSLDKSKKSSFYQDFPVPDDWYETIAIRCYAKRDRCKKVILSREIKNQNVNIFIFDRNQKPDFDWEWTYHQVIDNNFRVGVSDFEIEKIEGTYYAVIPEFDVEGYIKIDGSPSTNKPLILSDQYVDQIINLAAEEFFRDFDIPEKLQVAKDRTNSQE